MSPRRANGGRRRIRSVPCRHSPAPRVRRWATSNPMVRCTTRSLPTGSRHVPWPRPCTPSTPGCRCWVWPVRCSSPKRRASVADRGRGVRRSLLPAGRKPCSSRRPGRGPAGSDLIAERTLAMVHNGEVSAVDGTVIRIEVESVCVHGDSPGAVGIAGAVRSGCWPAESIWRRSSDATQIRSSRPRQAPRASRSARRRFGFPR